MYDVGHTGVRELSIASLPMDGSAFEDVVRGGRPTCVVAVVGLSDTGKTTLLERLIPKLRTRDLVVGAVKHTSHGFAGDRPGKDSHRIYSAGATAVTVVSGEQVATFRRRDGEREASLSEALCEMPAGLDLVLVEGFAWEPVVRVVLVRPGETPALDHLGGGPVLGVIEVAEPVSGCPPEFDDDLLDALVEQLMERVRDMRAAESRFDIERCRSWLPIVSELAKESA